MRGVMTSGVTMRGVKWSVRMVVGNTSRTTFAIKDSALREYIIHA